MMIKSQLIVVLIASFNRKELTTNCIEVLSAFVNPRAHLQIILIDGGSNDGTAQSIISNFPSVRVLIEPNTYWSEGMRIGMESAKSFSPDYILFLNDDVIINKTNFEAFVLESLNSPHPQVSVGKLLDSEAKTTSYGGVIVERKYGFYRFRRATNTEKYCDTFHGNCVLIPKLIFTTVGTLSSKFRHSFGDTDYGLRVTKLGFRVVQSSIFVGECKFNKDWDKYLKYPRLRELKRFFSDPKGLPIREWLYFSITHLGILWPLHFILRIFKILLRSTFRFILIPSGG